MPEYSKLSVSGVSGCILRHRYKMEKQLSFFEPFWVNVYLMHGYVAIITKTESTYAIIESTLWFDDVGVVLGRLLQAIQVIYAVQMVKWEMAWE